MTRESLFGTYSPAGLVRWPLLLALALCTPDGQLLQHTDRFPAQLDCAAATTLARQAEPQLALPGGPVHVGVHEVRDLRESAAPDAAPLGRLVLLHDLSFIERRSRDTQIYLIALITGLGFVIAVITMAAVQISWRGWMGEKDPWQTQGGNVTEPVLRALGIPYRHLAAPDSVAKTIRQAQTLAHSSLQPVALLLQRDLMWEE